MRQRAGLRARPLDSIANANSIAIDPWGRVQATRS